MASFCRDLCDGLIGNCRNCTQTPITRKKIYWFGGVTLFIIVLIIIICVSIPSGGTPTYGSDALSSGISNGVFFKVAKYAEGSMKNFEGSKVLDEVIANDVVKLQIFGVQPPCDSQSKDSVAITMEQINFLSRAIVRNSKLTLVKSYSETHQPMDNGRVASLLSLYGAHGIDNRLSILRAYAQLGVGVVTLAADGCGPIWAKSMNEKPITVKNETAAQISAYRKVVIKEMNRLGMVIDIAGLDASLLDEVLTTSEAPVVAMGIGIKSLVANNLNLDSNIVEKFNKNKGVLMLSTDCQLITNNVTGCSIEDFTNLLNYTRNLNIKVGFGGKLNSQGSSPSGLDPKNMKAYYNTLYDKGFSLDFLRGLATENFLTLLRQVEDISKKLKTDPDDTVFDFTILPKENQTCHTKLDPAPTISPPTA